MKHINGLEFQPYIGKYFGKNSNQKILLIGESFYDYEGDKEPIHFTEEIVNKFLNKGGNKTYSTIGEMFYLNDCNKIWHEVAFANLIQRFLEEPGEKPNKQDILIGKSAFKILLDTLKPDKVIILSKRMWEGWIPEHNGSYLTSIDIANKHSTIWKFVYKGGECLATATNHPSRIGSKQKSEWAKLMKVFLKY